MGYVYVYAGDADDFTGIGLCGALMPTECSFSEIANGDSSLTLTHPLDEDGMYLNLTEGNILKADVPVRTVPEITNGRFATLLEAWTVKEGAQAADRTLYNGENPQNKKHKKKVKVLPVGAEVIIVSKPLLEGRRWKAKYAYTEWNKKKKINVEKSASGYISPEWLEDKTEIYVPATSEGIEEAVPGWNIREQLFRIDSVKKSETEISCKARHISYDLLYNMTSYNEQGEKSLTEAAQGVLDGCFDAHAFTFQTNIQGTRAGHLYADKDPITALLNPDDGLVSRFKGELIRDNYELTVLDHAGVNRGTMLTYGRDIRGVEISLDMSKVATAVRPFGHYNSGSVLYLDKSYLIDDEGVAQEIAGDTRGIVFGRHHALVEGELTCDLPHARIYALEGEDSSCGKKDKDPNVETVRTRLLSQAKAFLLGGAEQVEMSATVDFVELGDTAQYELYRELNRIYLYDTVTILVPPLRAKIGIAVTQINWDCLSDSLTDAKFGSLQDLTPTVAGWQVSSLSGAKLVAGTVTQKQIKEDSITADQIQAEAVTAAKMAVGTFTADTATIENLRATWAKLTAAYISTLTAETIAADTIGASFMHATEMSAKAGTFDSAAVGHLVASVFNLTGAGGTAEDLYIYNLRATYAQMMTAMMDMLVVKGDDDKYYTVRITGGTVTATEYTAGVDETQGMTTDGSRALLPETMPTSVLSGDTVKAVTGVLNNVYAAMIDVERLFARKAFVEKLFTSSIYADGSLTIRDLSDQVSHISGSLDTIQRIFRQELPPDVDTANFNDIWIQTSNGRIHQLVGDMHDIAFAMDEDGNLAYTGDGTFEMFFDDEENADITILYNDMYDMRLSDEGIIDGEPFWEDVRDEETVASADAAGASAVSAGESALKAIDRLQQLSTYIELRVSGEQQGIHITNSEGSSEVYISSAAVNIGTKTSINDTSYSKFTGNFAQFGDYQMRRTQDGGLAFKLAK